MKPSMSSPIDQGLHMQILQDPSTEQTDRYKTE